ncbi:MAG: hypothetical protein IPG94_22705 [Kineosporiaceae bacterium]|nr:hypothetical protein [Kineosporiaceae bacterium]
MSDVRMIFETDDTQGDSVSIETRSGKPDELIVRGDATYLTRQQVTEMRTALGEWLASTAPEPEAAPEPIAPELIAGRRYQVGPNPTFLFDGGREVNRYLSEGGVVELVGDVNADGNAAVSTSGVTTFAIDPRHLTLLPEDEPTDRDVERDAQVAELARVVAELGRKVDALTSPNRPAPAVTHIHGRIDRLAARVNQLEADAAKPSPLHQAIADEIRRAAGAR